MVSALVKRGRFRTYLKHDYQTCVEPVRAGEGNSLVWDLLMNIVAVVYMSMIHTERLDVISTDDTVMWNEICDVINGTFFISAGVPTLVNIMGFVTKTLSLNIEFWKMANNVVLSTALVVLFKILRFSNVSLLVSGVLAMTFTQLSVFQDLVHAVSYDSYYMLFLLLVILHWRKLQRSKDFTFAWYSNMVLLSLSLIFTIGGKFIGLVSWAWLLLISGKTMWTLIGDLDVSGKQLFMHFSLRLFFFIILPLSSVCASYSTTFNNFDIGSPSLVNMTPDFQHYTMNLHHDVPSSIYYGSLIRLRHSESLGGYLTPLDIKYPRSNDTLITVSDNAEDDSSFWIIESAKKEPVGEDFSDQVVKRNDRIKLRNKKTGQLLRASEEKPPISDKKYDRRISATGDSEYEGAQDETWSVEIQDVRGFKTPLKPFEHRFVLRNAARRCSLLSHDIRMPKWAGRRQEVLGVETPTIKRALFYIDYVSPPQSRKFEKYEWPRSYAFYKLLFEYVEKQFKIVKKLNIDATNVSGYEFLAWPIGFSSSNSVGTVLWITSTVSIVFTLLRQIYTWLTWNIYDEIPELSPAKLMRKDITLESAMGWFLHVYIFSYSPHNNLSVVQYLPSLIYAVICLSQLTITC